MLLISEILFETYASLVSEFAPHFRVPAFRLPWWEFCFSFLGAVRYK